MIPTREIYWNVVSLAQAAMYLLMILPAFFLAYGIARRYLTWRRGKEYGPIDRIGERLKLAAAVAFLHRRLIRPGYLYAGIMHLFIFWGFVVLFIGTVLVMLQADVTEPYFGLKFLQGTFYVVYKLALNTFGFLFVVGLLMALYRRYVQAPPKFKVSLSDDAIALVGLLLLGLTGFFLQALRLAAESPTDPSYSYAAIHWVSYPFSLALAGLGKGTLAAIHTGTWWFHMSLTMGFLAYIGFSKMFHIFGGPANVFMRATDPKNVLAPIPNIEEQESFGASKLTDFNWKQLLNADACMRCGRCLDFCPTYNTGKPLKPRQLIVEIAAYMARNGGYYPGPSSPLPGEIAVRGNEVAGNGNPDAKALGRGAQLIGDVVSEEEIWDCTTCRACMEQCPVLIEHVPLIVELRRNLVLEQSSFPQELVSVFNNLERNGNPYQIAASTRADWAKGLNVLAMAEVEDPSELEVLYWVGCMASFDSRNQKVARALVKIFRAAGVKFAILGTEEGCSGDPARRAGNEYLFQILAQQNIETLNGYKPKRIVTACPHCFNAIGNEYQQFGGQYQVVHHSQLIAELIQSGRLALPAEVARQALTYHDPCYLGRYNEVYDAPRQVLDRINGGVAEMPRRRDRGFCCGAGGARAFMEERRGTRINYTRLKEAMSTGADTVAAACPFCMTMFEDGIRGLDVEEKVQIRDLAEIVAAALRDE